MVKKTGSMTIKPFKSCGTPYGDLNQTYKGKSHPERSIRQIELMKMEIKISLTFLFYF